MTGDDRARLSIRWLYLIFFFSGLCGLVYESIWSRTIRLFVGSAATAQILVLALFMGGMSLGAWLAGRWMHRVTRPVLLYGLVEGAVGCYALAFPALYAFTSRVAYDVVFPGLGSGGAVVLAKWSLAAALIVPPCVALGTTFPLMSVGILRRRPGESGRILGSLYFTNSVGAALGALVSGFVLVPRVGLTGALVFAGSVNLAIMLIAALERAPAPPLEIADRSAEGGTSSASPAGWHTLLLALALGTGLSSFIYEIAWIRLLSMVIGSATHSFEVMLSAFVLGLALGAALVRRYIDRFQRPAVILAVVQLVMGFCAVITIPGYQIAVSALGWLLESDVGARGEADWWAFNVLRYLLCLGIMLPATLCAGMTLPLVTHVALRRGAGEAVVGRIYAVNTLGAIAGAVLAGMVLLPLIGLRMALVTGAMVDMLLGIWVLWRHRAALSMRVRRQGIRLAQTATIAAFVFGTWVYEIDPSVLAATVFRNGRTRVADGTEVLFHEDGRTATVILTEDRDDDRRRVIHTNGKPDATVVLDRFPEHRPASRGPHIGGDEPNQFLVGLIPHMARPRATRAALIGFGSGVTAHVLLGSPHLERLDTIEIESNMVEGSRLFYPENARAYEDPRSHIIIDDAKAYFAASQQRYDLVVSEPTNPWVSGVSSLFTVEFYREVKRYLHDDGILCQWIQGYELGDALLLSVFAAIDDEFDEYLVVQVGALDWLILARPGSTPITLSDAPLDWEGMARTRTLLGIQDRGDIDALVSANRWLLHPLVGPMRPNTDAHPILDTGAEKARFMKLYATSLHEVRHAPLAMSRWIAGIERAPYRGRADGDLSDPTVFEDAERASKMLRLHEAPALALPPELDVDPMRVWQTAELQRAAGRGTWDYWLHATYGVYREVSPYVPLKGSAWWARVMDIRARAEGVAPPPCLRALDLLDALEREQGARLLALVAEERADDGARLPEHFVAMAGLVALRMTGAPPAALATYAETHMALPPPDSSGAAYAFEALRRWALNQAR